MTVPFQDLFNRLGIQKGDILYVFSDTVRLLWVLKKYEGSADLNIVINALQNAVGDEGTLLFPTFNWDFCQGLPFDYHKTPSMTGSLGSTALKRKDFKRTKHPIYSFAVWGKHADFLYSLENTDSFGEGSPFDFLYKEGGKHVSIDTWASITFQHYVEQCVGVCYRFLKNFTSTYIDENSISETKTYSMHVRSFELHTETKHGDIFVFNQCDKVNVQNINSDSFWRIIRFSDIFEFYKNDIINNKSRNLAIYDGQ